MWGDLEQTVSLLAATAETDRSDRLWPAEDELFPTNSMSLGYGACGPALLLHGAKRLPPAVIEWMRAQPLRGDEIPPSLLGLAGISLSWALLGDQQRGQDAIDVLYSSSLALRDPTIMLGAAGWGLVALDW